MRKKRQDEGGNENKEDSDSSDSEVEEDFPMVRLEELLDNLKLDTDEKDIGEAVKSSPFGQIDEESK